MNPGRLRRTAEFVLGPLVVRRRLPVDAGAGTIFASQRVGGLRYLLKRSRNWDPELINVAGLLVKPGHVVWDVGANVGLFSKAAAYHAGTRGAVISIEADIDAVTLLYRTCQRHSPAHAKMTVVPVAISDSPGFINFCIAKRSRSANFIEGFGSTQTGGVSEKRTLPCLTLDALLENFSPADVLKIDVEGAEIDVLRGGAQMIGNERPVIYCEVAKKVRGDFTQLLKNQDYRLWDGSGFKGTLGPEVSFATFNTVAIPAEKVGDYEWPDA